jgi:leucyl aminopeptidase (aminopeptidase T)
MANFNSRTARLRAALESKTREITAEIVASGLPGDEAQQIIEDSAEAFCANTPEESTAVEERMAKSVIGRLLLERHEIEQQLLDELDESSIRAAARRAGYAVRKSRKAISSENMGE